MFHKIIVAVDLADPAPTPKGLDQAVELATASGGLLRLVNIQPLMPATFMEYVPADFDAEQEKRAHLPCRPSSPPSHCRRTGFPARCASAASTTKFSPRPPPGAPI